MSAEDEFERFMAMPSADWRDLVYRQFGIRPGGTSFTSAENEGFERALRVREVEKSD